MKLVDSYRAEIKVGDRVLIRNDYEGEHFAAVVEVCEGNFMDELIGEQRNGVYLMDNEGTCVGLDSALKDKFATVIKVAWDF